MPGPPSASSSRQPSEPSLRTWRAVGWLPGFATLVAVMLTGAPDAAPLLAQATVQSAIDEFICGSEAPNWRGRYATLATQPANGAPLYYYQDPPFLTADYQGNVVLRDFTVVGDRQTMRLYHSRGGIWEFDEFPRTTTRMIKGVFVSVFDPIWSMAGLLDRAANGFSVYWDNQGAVSTFVYADATAPPGQLPAGAIPIQIRSGPKHFRPVAITKVSDSVQFSSHIVNLVVPGFGDGRALDNATTGIDLREVTRKFYETFEDSYDTIVAIPEARHVGLLSGFHAVVQNRIEGIGLQLMDDTRAYGSSGTLQGAEYLAVLNNIGIKHEQAHQWGDYFDWARIGGVPGTSSAHSPVWADRETPLPGLTWWMRISQVNGAWQTVRATFPHTFSPMML